MAGVLLTACRRDMQDQPRYEMYEPSAFYEDGAAVRPLPEHTVPRGFLREDALFYTGRTGGSASASQTGGAQTGAAQSGGADQGAASFEAGLATTIPMPLTRELIDRGEGEFRTFCAVCHGLTGEGDGIVARRGYRTPPSYHTERLRAAPVGHFFDVMTNGWGAMPSYGYLVPPADRWAIAAYIRALQLSRSARLAELPPGERERLASYAAPSPAATPANESARPAQSPARQGAVAPGGGRQ